MTERGRRGMVNSDLLMTGDNRGSYILNQIGKIVTDKLKETN